VNGSWYIVANAGADTFELTGTNSSGWGTYTSAGTSSNEKCVDIQQYYMNRQFGQPENILQLKVQDPETETDVGAWGWCSLDPGASTLDLAGNPAGLCKKDEHCNPGGGEPNRGVCVHALQGQAYGSANLLTIQYDSSGRTAASDPVSTDGSDFVSNGQLSGWAANPSVGGNTRLLKHYADFSGIDAGLAGTFSNIYWQSPATNGSGTVVTSSRLFEIDDQKCIGNQQCDLIDIDAQTLRAGHENAAMTAQIANNILHRGGNWNNGHFTFSHQANGTTDHIWFDQTQSVMRVSPNDSNGPAYAADGQVFATNVKFTADPCSTAGTCSGGACSGGPFNLAACTNNADCARPEGFTFYNDTSDYYCFCNGSGEDVKMHAQE
jgi:hypothetical protein